MIIIAGLGNPGAKYDNTRHNIGFMAIDALAKKLNINIRDAKFKGLCGSGYAEGQKVLLLKPQTFMNLSGESIAAALNFYKESPEDSLIVLCDDIYLPPGKLRIRQKGSAGGHNGLKNIILHTGSEGFSRVRIGVGEKPKDWDLADWVLGAFPREDKDSIDKAVEDAAEAVLLMAAGDTAKAMNKYN